MSIVVIVVIVVALVRTRPYSSLLLLNPLQRIVKPSL